VTNKPGKYAAALMDMQEPKQPPAVLLPERRPVLLGKRSTPGWKQKAVLLKEESINHAQERLRRRGDKTDFSDLMQALLDAWLATPE
jgi:hypothetical protein